MIHGTRVRRTAVATLTTGVVLSVPLLSVPAQAAAPTVTARGAYMVDAGTGRALFSKGSTTKRSMASLTKVMTADVVLNAKGLNLSKKITIKQAYVDRIWQKNASSAYLKVGDKLTVRQLLSAMLLPSGCDAAYALADTFGTGSTTAARTKSFVAKMNARAKTLGMTSTKYDSFDGISNGSNYSTPKDLTKLARDVLKSPTFKAVADDQSYVAKATASNGRIRTYTWYNTNKLLSTYRGAIGLKTGSGPASGYCLMFAAKRGDRTITGVLLASTSEKRFPDATKLLDHAFRTAP
ncbi:D-alanyl-D-alanine carboxypeptidase family protein [Streptomyces sp. NPDC060194]|uniref:D-alanyl-D-alanine carboxypeptidase family protein n=1 Tax=Streptomyces sp. NPDC060194 TaxID=3347069 RepID=UPI003649F9B2